ncbi:Serine/threonine protein kinase PrkC, regulator of stationary phase [hydrothermal vent metagenome]|uniref:Serine/threonine protein kinase PrkC, regulator of stationary phase n=1 Tax=hydrothermal vent metagenome TaxID=652676 RepID=A0A3B0Y4Y2_9ZZZZ
MNGTDTVIQHPTKDRHPSVFGKYQVQYKIGQGAMGAVYKAYDPSIDRIVAIKTISPGILLTDDSGEFKERFLREVRATGKINHPNIISVYDSGELDGNPFFVMEYVEGKELKEFLADNSTVSLEYAKKIICQILDALSYSHDCDIVHRDIKPSNIFIDVKGNVKIADFGIAKQSNSNLTQTGSIIGTPSYMSPEQCQGKAVDHRSDLFSAAVVFYEMLTGEKCFNGSSGHVIMHRILTHTPEKPSILNVNVPEVIDNIILKAISKNPSDRYSGALDFKRAIEKSKSVSNYEPQKKHSIKLALLLVSAVVATVIAAYALFDKHNQESHLDRSENTMEWNQATVEPVALSEQNKITRLLKVAKAHRLVGRIIEPQGSNAYATYRLILSINPDNVQAIDGLEQVKQQLFEQTKLLLEQGKKEQAKSSIDTALLLFPADAQYLELLKVVDN